MCGIIAAISVDGEPVNDRVLNQYQKQFARGTEGFGAAMVLEDEPDKVNIYRATTELKTYLDLYLRKAQIILFHHRMPTSSDNLMSQTHPILVSNPLTKYAWLIAHNGIIQNSEEIKKIHNEVGIEYNTQIKDKEYRNYNDSEAIAVELALYLERQKEKIEAKGSMALVGLQMDKTTMEPLTMFFTRNAANPLNVWRNEHAIFISSLGGGQQARENMITVIDLKKDNLPWYTQPIILPEYTYRALLQVNNPLYPDRTETNAYMDNWREDEDYSGATNADPKALEDENFREDEPDWQTAACEEYVEELNLLVDNFTTSVTNEYCFDDAEKDAKILTDRMAAIVEEMRDAFAHKILIDGEKADKNGPVTVTNNKPTAVEAEANGGVPPVFE